MFPLNNPGLPSVRNTVCLLVIELKLLTDVDINIRQQFQFNHKQANRVSDGGKPRVVQRKHPQFQARVRWPGRGSPETPAARGTDCKCRALRPWESTPFRPGPECDAAGRST